MRSKFSTEHYEAIAKLFSANKVTQDWRDLAWIVAFADMFEKDNPRFKRERFIDKALGGEEGVGDYSGK